MRHRHGGSVPGTAPRRDSRAARTAGTHKTSSFRVAEASKVIENAQRDVNIALVNELAMLFNKLDIDTEEVLTAAGTKWNFLPFSPGLVGGHCIGVDPYYLTHKTEAVGHHPEIILAGRRINDHMGEYVAGEVIKLKAKNHQPIAGSRILVLTFKENTPDIRNTQVIDIVRELKSYNAMVDVHDPWIDPCEARNEYGIELTAEPEPRAYNAAVIAVGHREFNCREVQGVRQYLTADGLLYDIKSVFPVKATHGRL